MPDKTEKLTAKEIEHKIFWGGVAKCTKKDKIELIKEYARQKCKEQRNICASAFGDINTKQEHFHTCAPILNASEPKFD